MKRRGVAGIAVQLPAMFVALGAVLFGCGGGAEGPPPVRPDDGVKGIEGLEEGVVECESTPDVESFFVRDEGNGKQVPDGGATQNPMVQVRVTLRESLPKGCVVRVLRDDEPQPRGLTVCDRSCSFTDRLPDDGIYEFRVRTEAGGAPNTVGTSLGNLSDTYTIALDRVAPAETVVSIVSPSDANQETRDTRPRISGTVNARLSAGKLVKLQRGSGEEPTKFELLGLLEVRDQDWSYQEPLRLLDEGTPTKATFKYRASVVDAAGNESAAKDFRLTINTALAYTAPVPTLKSVNGMAIPEPTSDAPRVSSPLSNRKDPTLAGTIGALDTARQVLRVYRNGAPALAASGGTTGEANLSGTDWTFASAALPDGDHVFRVRVEERDDPTQFGAGSEVTVPIDATPPKAPVIHGLSNNRPFQFVSGYPNVFNLSGQSTQEVKFGSGAVVTDADPRIVVTYTIAPGERLIIKRAGTTSETVVSAIGASSISFRLPQFLNRTSSVPTPVGANIIEYTATQTDQAQNEQVTTFRFSLETVDCNKAHARASTRPEVSVHTAWVSPGVGTCGGCHATSMTNGQPYVAVRPTRNGIPEVNYLGERNWYWCRKL